MGDESDHEDDSQIVDGQPSMPRRQRRKNCDKDEVKIPPSVSSPVANIELDLKGHRHALPENGIVGSHSRNDKLRDQKFPRTRVLLKQETSIENNSPQQGGSKSSQDSGEKLSEDEEDVQKKKNDKEEDPSMDT